MQINWLVRIRNPMWWVQVVASIVMPLIVGMGSNWEAMTSWPLLGSTILSALQNQVGVMTMLVSLWGAITDPTTKGFGDSSLAMTYEKPKDDAATTV